MLHRPVSGLAGIVVLLCCAAAAEAQEFRVYTQLIDARHAAPGGEHRHLRGRSTSLFHAGRVYDWIDAAGNQITIFEPAHQRFVIIEESTRQSAILSFEDIDRRIYQAAARAREYVDRERQNPSEGARVEFFEFQLDPKFKESFDESERVLTLRSKWLTYELKCAAHESPEVIKGYLDYADWLARLNFVIQPQALFPGPRLALDEALRRRGLLPVEVTLRSANEKGLQLRAKHRFDWKLDNTDRDMIRDADALMLSRTIKQVSLEKLLPPVAGKRPQERK